MLASQSLVLHIFLSENVFASFLAPNFSIQTPKHLSLYLKSVYRSGDKYVSKAPIILKPQGLRIIVFLIVHHHNY